MRFKNIFLLIPLSLFFLISNAQQKPDNYESSWRKIDSLVNKSGLIKTALKEVNSIYAAAKKQNNDVQVIKALIYRLALNDQLSEEGKYENIDLLEKEILTAKEPARSILSSIAAGSYWHYLQLNRWQLYDRTSTSGSKKPDPATWSLDDLHARIS